MNKNVQNKLIVVSVIIVLLIMASSFLIGLLASIPAIAFVAIKSLIMIITGIIIGIIVFIFLLYWWSEVTWDKIKRKYKR